MRCRKHLTDHSSSVGVCATCLRERLLPIIAAQARQDSDQAHQKPNSNPPPPLLFPRSVSPYISRRKSDTASATWHHHHNQIRSYHSLPDPKFFSTPQIGPTLGLFTDQCKKKKKSNKYGFFSSLFRSKSSKLVDDSRSTNSTSSTAWLPNFLGKKQPTTFSSNGPGSILKPIGHRNRGMSPETHSDDESSYTSDEWRQTPRRTPAASVGQRCSGRSTQLSQLSRNVSGMSFCLSPMVRASPCRNWSHKGGVAPPEMVVSAEIRAPITTSFCKSRSRKLADIGRSSHNR